MNKQEFAAEMAARIMPCANSGKQHLDEIIKLVEARRKVVASPTLSSSGGLVVAPELVPIAIYSSPNLGVNLDQTRIERMWEQIRAVAAMIEARTRPNPHARKLWLTMWGGY